MKIRKYSKYFSGLILRISVLDRKWTVSKNGSKFWVDQKMDQKWTVPGKWWATGSFWTIGRFLGKEILNQFWTRVNGQTWTPLRTDRPLVQFWKSLSELDRYACEPTNLIGSKNDSGGVFQNRTNVRMSDSKPPPGHMEGDIATHFIEIIILNKNNLGFGSFPVANPYTNPAKIGRAKKGQKWRFGQKMGQKWPNSALDW